MRVHPPSRARVNQTRDSAYLGHWLDQGYAVVASDYAGLGSEGDHAYLDGASTARNIVDMITAAHSLDTPGDAELSKKWVSVGYSQGAGAALYTARYATQFGGEFDYRGMAGTGTPVRVADDIVALGPDISEPAPADVTAYVAYMLDGIRQAAPELDAVLSDAGRDVLEISRTQCLDELADTLKDRTIGEFFERPVDSNPALVNAVRTYLDIPERGYRPFLLAHGTADIDVRYERTAKYAEDLRSAGEPITFLSYQDVTHGQSLDAARADVTDFVSHLLTDNTTRRAI